MATIPCRMRAAPGARGQGSLASTSWWICSPRSNCASLCKIVATSCWMVMDLDSPGDIYLARVILLKTHGLGVYLHMIYRPDYARC